MGGGEQCLAAHSLHFSSRCLPVSNLCLVFLCFSPPTSMSVSMSQLPSLSSFFPPPNLSCVSLDQTGEALHSATFISSISVTVKKKIASLGSCLCFVVLIESQIEEVVLKASWPLSGDTHNDSCGLGSLETVENSFTSARDFLPLRWHGAERSG